MDENLAIDDQSNPPQAGSTPGSLKFTFAPPGTAAPVEGTPTTPAGKSDTNTATVEAFAPGKRTQNPLANFSSYTYQISLYMITPDAYESFLFSGRKSINNVAEITPAQEQSARDTVTSNNAPTRTGGQANGDAGGSGSPPPPSAAGSSAARGGTYLIAQSGGINNSNTVRAPGFDLDFFLDDLKITQVIGTKDVGAETNYSTVTFTITEPYGFSLLTKLRQAQTALSAVTSTPNFNGVSDPLRQLYIVGIKFLGYDKNGELIDPSKLVSSDGDPIGNSSGIYERFYDIIIRDMKFKITGKAVTYNIVAANASTTIAFTTKFGRVPSDVNVTADTVYNALKGGTGAAGAGRGGGMVGLFSKLNYDQQQMLGKGVKIAREYDVTFIGPTSDFIKNASLVSINDLDKRKVPTTSATNSSQSNEKASQNNPIQSNLRTIKIVGGTPIIQAVNTIIKQSQYMEKALSAIAQAADLTPDPDKKEITTGGSDSNSGSTTPAAKPSPISWYNMHAEVKNLGWDENQSDYIYKINYIIQQYETPIVTAASVKVIPHYYGAQKRYEYWYTGKNSEILGYEQQMDYTYHNVTLKGYGVDGTIPPEAQGGNTDIPVTFGLPQDQPKQGRINGGMESQNEYMTSLFSPTDFAKAKIKILGDPDFLMQPAPSSINSLYNQFYGTDGFTINPNGGQVFIEINFKEPQDYHNDTGTMSINSSIYFWKFPEAVQKALNSRGGGISYLVNRVVSSFNKGKFEQELDCYLNTFGSSKPSSNSASTAADQGRPATNQTDAETARLNRAGTGSATTPSGTGTTNSSGFGDSKPAILGSASMGGTPNATTTVSTRGGPMLKQNTTVTNTKGVQEDDAGYDSTAGLY